MSTCNDRATVLTLWAVAERLGFEVEDAVVEVVVLQVLPDVLDRVELGAEGRQGQGAEFNPEM